MGRGGHTGHIGVEHVAGGHQLIAALLLHIALEVLIHFRLHAVHFHRIGKMGTGALRAGQSVAAAQQFDGHYRGHHQHQQHHQQVYDVNFSKQSSLFVQHLFKPPRL